MSLISSNDPRELVFILSEDFFGSSHFRASATEEIDALLRKLVFDNVRIIDSTFSSCCILLAEVALVFSSALRNLASLRSLSEWLSFFISVLWRGAGEEER